MTSIPLISVCIVTYNHQAYIADCLNSVLAQYGDFRLEVLLGDDTSNDNTVNIIQRITDQYRGNINIHLFAHEKNLGPSQNYQFLIEKAQGDFIAHLDGDDFWLPGKLQTQLQFLHNNPDCPACYTNAVVIRDDKSHWGFFNTATTKQRISTAMLLKNGNFLNHSSLLYRVKNKDDILSFPENFIDYRIHLQLSLNGELGYINQVLVAYRVNSSTSQLIKMKNSVLLMYIDALISVKENVSTKLFQEAILSFYRSYYINIKVNYNKETIRSIKNTLEKYYPLNLPNIFIKILPYTITSEINNFLYKKISGSQPRFLQRNNIG
ncbi:glycosyltransferase [Thiothrix sp.]|jgi:glycosyltransferase involved in cell wall biosynthesis|uniref:glycosyltransferase family 2 protein n=1 Tax=Thiothrix sp. TaxID=1032 RepID=UPI00257FC29A|nr:glycosyltransferase [Thiothrix sp.]